MAAKRNRTSIPTLPIFWLLVLLQVCVVMVFNGLPNLQANDSSTRIAMGSCANQEVKQPIWEAIVATQPDGFVFLGDNVYADTEDMDEMRNAYRALAEKEGYQALLNTCPVYAIWDDHDYGVNDGGAEFPMREGAEKVFHEFFQTPEDSDSRRRPGIYDVDYVRASGGQMLQLIRLDTRYFRGPLVKLPKRGRHGPYDRNFDRSATILGEGQWAWLAEVLGEPADLRVIATSIQFLPQDHQWERWENFPHERQKLLDLLKEKETGPVIFLSGDRHMGEIMKLRADDPASPGFPIYEITSSGLTNAGGGRPGEPNRHRVSPTNFQSRNFGLVTIDWNSSLVELELRNVGGDVVDAYRVDLTATE
jgi:alkaline phosphatase D